MAGIDEALLISLASYSHRERSKEYDERDKVYELDLV